MEYTISPEQYAHIKQKGFNPKICQECQEIDIIFKEQLANANLLASAPDLYEVLLRLIEALEKHGSPHNDVRVAYNGAKPALAKAKGS